MTQHRLDYAGIKESKIKLDNSIKRISGEQEKPSTHSWANIVELEIPWKCQKVCRTRPEFENQSTTCWRATFKVGDEKEARRWLAERKEHGSRFKKIMNRIFNLLEQICLVMTQIHGYTESSQQRVGETIFLPRILDFRGRLSTPPQNSWIGGKLGLTNSQSCHFR